MLCPGVLQPSPGPMRSFLDLHWPVRSLWPETRPLLYHMEQEMLRHMQEVQQSMEHMERIHQQIFQQIDSSSGSQGVFLPIGFQDLGRDGGRFALSLDTTEFRPEELSVQQVGRKLRVSGRTEKQQEDGRGSSSFRCQEFRQEFHLPDGVEPQEVSCSLAGGRLQIQAPRGRGLSDGKERVVPITVTSAPAVTCPPSEGPGGGSSSSETSTTETN
ncbi:heat shock protein beta-11 [Limanda limanda]|uniref:heat shock protein beta-11 n=1 Tax=Limanda limanda TaxID=27771 RepID=UPI0029C9879B|nr:heat shock protein beta-11 [Limanda limanda]